MADEEDLFADLYEGDEEPKKPDVSEVVQPVPEAAPAQPEPESAQEVKTEPSAVQLEEPAVQSYDQGDNNDYENVQQQPAQYFNQESEQSQNSFSGNGFPATVGIKEDGKMFIGGLNWETTDQSLHDYFAQFGEVLECTVMRDGATGRSRGFGFLTFKDPKTVNTVMVKEHFLDGKIIDPKRAIPREEQERTSKIFVGGVSQDATERDFEQYFAQFGRVVDATLMMDKDTGRPRGFGFVTFEGEAAVDATLAQPLAILGKPIEVKRAQPRGNLDRDDDGGGRFGRGGRGRGRGGFDRNHDGGHTAMGGGNGMQGMPDSQANTGSMTPAMMAQYWAKMQQWFTMMQAMQAGQGNAQMNPAMLQQQQQQMQMMQQMQRGPNGGQMNPAMLQQQQQQMQMMQQMQQQAGGQQRMFSPMQGGSINNRPDSAASQQAFGKDRGGATPSSWEGMYDDVPEQQGNGGGGQRGGRGRGGFRGGGTPQPAPQAPLNAPTGPKNAGRPGANFRGGRGGHRGFHPYSRG